MLIDLHNHTSVSSPCSLLSTEELIETARVSGLDGICITDHLLIEGAEVAQEYGRKVNFPVFRGVEARSLFGDMLVFGFYKDIPEGISLDDLCWYVHEVGGVLFAAHPFHTTGGANLYASIQEQGLDLETDWDKLGVLRQLDGVETVNGQVPDPDPPPGARSHPFPPRRTNARTRKGPRKTVAGKKGVKDLR